MTAIGIAAKVFLRNSNYQTIAIVDIGSIGSDAKKQNVAPRHKSVGQSLGYALGIFEGLNLQAVIGQGAGPGKNRALYQC